MSWTRTVGHAPARTRQRKDEAGRNEGTMVHLTAGAAEALNGAFETDALEGGTKIGIGTVEVKLPRSTGMPAGVSRPAPAPPADGVPGPGRPCSTLVDPGRAGLRPAAR